MFANELRRHACAATLLGISLTIPQARAEQALVYSTDFTSGYYSSMQVEPPYAPMTNIQSTCSDAVARAHSGLVYLLGRFGCDFIQVVDPGAGFATTGQFSTGNGTNPQDIEVYTPTKAYVSLYETDYVLIVNPQTGQHLGQISLATLSDDDGLPEAAEMVLVGNRLFVALQRLDRAQGFAPLNPSFLAVIDCDNDVLVDVDPQTIGTQAIVLTGRNPFSEVVFDAVRQKIVVAQAGAFGALDGGAEFVDPVAQQAEGFFISETELGGDINSLRLWVDCNGYAVITDASFNTQLVRFSHCTGESLQTCLQTPGFLLADLEITSTGVMLVADRDLVQPGVRAFQLPGCGETTATPISFGLPPQDIALVGDCAPTATDIAPPAASITLWPNWPDPFNPGTTLRFEVETATRAVLDVIDVRGRRLAVVWDGPADAGTHEVRWQARDASGRGLPSGVYFARLRTAGAMRFERLTLVR